VSDQRFVDTNVLLYLIGPDGDKATRAEHILADGAWISVQVLNEFANVARRKHSLDWDELDHVLETIKSCCKVVALDEVTHRRGLAVARRYRLSVCDAMIVAAALELRCTLLWSEDLQHGQVIDGLTVLNPFLPA
jgi:predicted nucleic acid-binding protein